VLRHGDPFGPALGSEVSRAEAALQMLKAVSFSRLILLAIFSAISISAGSRKNTGNSRLHSQAVESETRLTVVWVEGNHDHGLCDVMSHLVGI